ncbi:MAG TPA: DNA-processing protein DprA [Candidatus Woesebacteria bacterium]|nr:DNA-processing protein DprA [Candidatus Woesebacteria bacterium]
MKHWKEWKIEKTGNWYYRGEWRKEIFTNTLAIVGSRRMTRYGKEVINKFMPEIVSRKTTVISGFMYGVDTAAHLACVELGGTTVAVLGSGLDVLTPVENDKLYSQILDKGGVVISEFEPDFIPTLWSFPQRNKTVVKLATMGVLVVEAGIKSGSLITAKIALKQNKTVMAVPGPINSSVSLGTNWLIKTKAAKMITSPEEIYGDKFSQTEIFKDYSQLSVLEKNIINVLENEALTIDDLYKLFKLPITQLNSTLSMMIVRDLILEENGKYYIK